MKKLSILTFIAIILFSCTTDDDSPNFHYETLPVEEAIIPESFEWNETYDITLEYKLPSTCHTFFSVYYEHDQDDETKRIIAVISRVTDDAICSDESRTKEHTFQIEATQEEDYVFKIWKGTDPENDEDIFEEITVAVTKDTEQE